MANQQTQTAGRRNPVLSIALPSLLIAHLLWNLLTPAHEYPMRTEQVLTMTFDCFMLLGVVGLRESMPKPLFWTGLVAGLGLFALRLTGDSGWWTGHLVYFIPPR